MSIKGLRQERNWSQERLAEVSGLSLRTIQRLEHRDKASLDSIVALAAAFEIEVAALQQELAVSKTSKEWKKRPVWVRGLFFGSGWIQMDKKQHKRVEIVAVLCGSAFLVAGILGQFGSAVFLFGSLLILGAYLMSVSARVGDEHSVWPWLDSDTEQ